MRQDSFSIYNLTGFTPAAIDSIVRAMRLIYDSGARQFDRTAIPGFMSAYVWNRLKTEFDDLEKLFVAADSLGTSDVLNRLNVARVLGMKQIP